MLMPEDFETTSKPGNIWSLFHRAWGMAKESPNYQKETMRELEAKIMSLQYMLNELVRGFELMQTTVLRIPGR